MTRLTTLPKALSAVRAKLLPYQPQTGESYYGFTSGSARVDVGASITVYVLDSQGVPAGGVHVYNLRPDGKFEDLETGGNGQVTFYLGRGSYFFSPTEGPHTVFVGEGGNQDEGTLPTVKGDRVTSMGLPEGHHVDYSLTFRQMTAGKDDMPSPTPMPTPTPTPPTPPPPTPSGSLGDAINYLEQALAILRNMNK